MVCVSAFAKINKISCAPIEVTNQLEHWLSALNYPLNAQEICDLAD